MRRAAFRTVASLNPIAGSPAAALETDAALDVFGPSLIPRAALHQGMAAGLAVLAARGVAGIVEVGTGVLSGGSSALRPRLAAAAVIAAAGQGLTRIPAADGEPLAISAVRSSGWLISYGAVSGAVYDTSAVLRERIPGPAAPRIVLTSLAGTAVTALVARKRLRAREHLIKGGRPATSPPGWPSPG